MNRRSFFGLILAIPLAGLAPNKLGIRADLGLIEELTRISMAYQPEHFIASKVFPIVNVGFTGWSNEPATDRFLLR